MLVPYEALSTDSNTDDYKVLSQYQHIRDNIGIISFHAIAE